MKKNKPYLFHATYVNGRRKRRIGARHAIWWMGVVHFGPLLDIMSERMGELQRLLGSARSSPVFSLDDEMSSERIKSSKVKN